MTSKLLLRFRCALLFLALSVLGNVAIGQTTVQIGSGTTNTSYFPIYSCYGYNYSQQIYLASEMAAGGASGASYINKIRFQPTGTIQPQATWTSWDVYIGNTTNTEFANSTSWIPTSAMTQVFVGTIPATLTSGQWMELTFPTPFLWDGSSNLVVAVHEYTPNYYCTQTWAGYTTTPATGYRGILFYSDPTNPSPASPPTANYTNNTIAQVQFDITPAAACTAPPVPGTATVSNPTPCFGGTINLNLTGNSVGSGQTYQWESAASLAGPWTAVNTPAASPYYATTASATQYYRAAVTCGASTLYSTEVLVTVPSLFPAGTYTIDSTQAPSATNFQSISDAVAAISCGIAGPVVFNVANNVAAYNEEINLGLIGNVSATNTVTFNGNGAMLKSTATSSAEPAIVKLNGAKFVTINNFIINGHTTSTSVYQWGVWLTNNADSNTISNCTILLDSNTTTTAHCGIVVSGGTSATTLGSNCDGNTITNNVISGGYYGLTLCGASGSSSIINGNTITNNTIRNFYVYGIYATYTNNTLAENNDISRAWRTSVTTFGPIYFTTGNTKATITRNKVHNAFTSAPTSTSTAYGIYLGGSTSTAGNEHIISNNIVYNIEGNGTVYGMYNTGSGYTRYYHNTISMDYGSNTGGTAYGFYQTTSPGSGATIELKNNIFTVNRAAGTNYGIRKNTAATPIVSDYNNVVVSGGTSYFGYWSSNQATLAAWQTASSQDAASQTIPPMYVSPSTGDLTPVASALDNLGTNVGVTVDINNAARSVTTPDMGAYEFSVPPCGGSPVAGTVTGPAMVCTGIGFTMSLTGFTVGSGITIQWEASAAGAGFWTPITGATNSSYTETAGISTATDYRAVVTCANGGGFDISNVLAVSMNSFLNCYCTSNATSIGDEDIFNVTFGSLNNSSTCSTLAPGPGSVTAMYSNYKTSVTAPSVTQGDAVPFSVQIGTCNGNYGNWTKIFIDYNQNGLFTDAGEMVYSSPSSTTGPHIESGIITIPMTASVGQTVMRVVTVETTVATGVNPCGTYSWGETEDYLVDILQAQPCTGTPLAGNAYGPATVCPNVTFTVVDTAYTSGLGVTFQWESSPAGAGTWAPISGAVSSSLTVAGGITAATDYRLVVTCTNSSISSTSNTVAVAMNPFFVCYCGPATGVNLNSITSNYLTNVTRVGGSLNNTSTTPGAASYTLYYPTTANTTDTLMQGQQYTLNTTHQFTGYYSYAWIDYDQSGTFDAGEYIALTTSGANGMATFTVPLSATPGLTGLRVRTYYTTINAGQACATNMSYETEDYVISILAAPPCAGTPTAGIAAGPSGVCTGADFTLTLTGYSVGTGISIQWESSPASAGSWTAIAGATTPTYTVTGGISTATDYRAIVTCANGGGFDISNTIATAINLFYNCYCTSGATSTFDGEIFNVTLASLNNTSSCPGLSPSYASYTNLTPASIGQGTTIPVSLSAGSCNGSYGGYAKVYIDYNQNGSFADPGEEAFVSSSFTYSPAGTLVSGNITVPLTATLGTTGMRVIMMETGSAASITPCGTFSYGETEDYLVTITAPPACLPVNTLTVTNVLSTSATLGWTSPGSATQWIVEYGPQGFTLGTGTMVTATTNPYVLTGLNPNTAYSFYVTADCGSSVLSTTTGPVSFMTAQIPQTIFPYAQNWETGGTDWTLLNGSQTNKWYVGSSVFFSGSNSLYISNNAGASNTYDVTASSVVAAYRDLDLTSFSSAIPMTFAWRGFGESGWDWLRVFVVPLSYVPVPGTSLYNNLPAGGVELSPSANGYNQSSTWQSVNTAIPVQFAGGLARLVFEWRNDGSLGTQPAAAMDALTIGGFPLVVDLKNITAANAGSRNRVDWTTASELKSDKFELERSADGRNFIYLATINARGEASSYSYWDENPVTGVNYYRLKMVEANGNSTYSKTVQAVVKSGAFTVEAYPNPVGDVLTVKAYGTSGSNATVSVSDATGKVVRVIAVSNGMAQIDMTGMAQGIYLVKYADSNNSQTIKVNKQ